MDALSDLQGEDIQVMVALMVTMETTDIWETEETVEDPTTILAIQDIMDIQGIMDFREDHLEMPVAAVDVLETRVITALSESEKICKEWSKS